MNLLLKDMWKDCIVIFDEAHNIDNVCLEVFTVNMNRKLLDMAFKNVEILGQKVIFGIIQIGNHPLLVNR